jgi:hypothetical protein
MDTVNNLPLLVAVKQEKAPNKGSMVVKTGPHITTLAPVHVFDELVVDGNH